MLYKMAPPSYSFEVHSRGEEHGMAWKFKHKFEYTYKNLHCNVQTIQTTQHNLHLSVFVGVLFYPTPMSIQHQQ
jgi:hypothetical protein